MINGEIDKKIEFIIEQQAQFSAKIKMMRDVHKADAKLFNRHCVGSGGKGSSVVIPGICR